MHGPKLRFALIAGSLITIGLGFVFLSSSVTGLFDLVVKPVFADDPGCTNEDCPPDPGCTNEDCPPDPGCTNEDCPPDPGCTNEDCPPPYWDGCCCYEAYNPATERTERICCCNDEQNLSCRWSYVTDPVAPLHERISEIFVELDPVPGDEQGLCTPDWLIAYLGDAWEPLSESCEWWARLQECPMGVIVDIKPGSDPNSINPNSRGKIPVAILSTTDFDALTVDTHSLTFGATGNEDSLVKCGAEDVDGDGLEDLICHFATRDAGFSCGDLEGYLRGQTLNGVPLEGVDSVNLVPCK